ncbi:hypothetical protein ACJMK2_036573 [Sinanodonta woodiana]|uniref:Reticulon-like protein n=1 Tax=Sinanodonta woodiana TaxID=1069815 RepID=A0ABD3WLS6_SINWO
MAYKPDYPHDESFEKVLPDEQDEGVSTSGIGFLEEEDEFPEEGTTNFSDDYSNSLNTFGQDDNFTTQHSDTTPIGDSEPIFSGSSHAYPSAPPIPQTRVTESTPPPTELFEQVSYSAKSQQDKGFSERRDEKAPAVPASWMKNVDPREEVEDKEVILPYEHREEAEEKVNLETTSVAKEILNEAAEVAMLVSDAQSVEFSDKPGVSQAYRKDSLEEEKDEIAVQEEESDMFGEGPETDIRVSPKLVSSGISNTEIVAEAESDDSTQDAAEDSKSDSSQEEVKAVDDKEFKDSSSEDLETSEISEQENDRSPAVNIDVSFKKQTGIEADLEYEEGSESPLGSTSDHNQEKDEGNISEELNVSGGAENEAVFPSETGWQNEKEFVDENISPENQKYTDESPEASDGSSDEGIEPGQIDDTSMNTELSSGFASQNRDIVIPVFYSQQVFTANTAQMFAAECGSDKNLVDIAEDDAVSERLDSGHKDPSEFVQELASASVIHDDDSFELKGQQQAPEYTNDEVLDSSLEEPIVSSTSGEAPAVAKEVHFTQVRDLIYWKDVKKTGVVFGSMMFIFLSLVFFSLLSVLAYLALAILTVTFTFRLYKSVMQAVQKSNEGHPFRKYLEMDLNLKEAVVEKAAENIAKNLNCVLGELRRLFLVEDIVDSLKFGMLLYLLTYIGCCFNGMTLVIMAVVAVFTIPKVYDTYKIDSYINLIRCQFNKILTQIQSKLPFLKKKEKSQ